ncbi:putative bifunctional diguanylate cyclase/phosphodiesterase [Chelativorans sp. M5D2P16]|uniref:putative bifunctional diguanylate cyclase/phosphodiesterase n=1 Tax=Chelativorans sp. M5D2P16 TaxID=3095678 RepID=UPI002ACA3BE5|nr:EAL domain-containing protein [Chelativorans sp. M5D2P16]MDZ5698052.1 EAL domain-containing protein [Chelativorans sp. M5D2P16]
MKILSTIRSHGGPVYAAIQGLLLTAAGAASLSTALAWQDIAAPWLMPAAAAASAAGSGLLAYLRRAITHRLDQAETAEAKMQKLIDTDLMTGTMMRHVFLEALNESVGTLTRHRKVTLLLVDLDHFKRLNDSFGHHFGDKALTHFAECMRASFPDCDVGRLGGDEFGIIMPGNELKRAERRARHLIEKLGAGVVHEGSVIPLSASIGIAAAPQHATTAKELMILADLALYESKSGGRSKATPFDGEMLSEKRHRRYVERELRAAIYLNELELHYQPVTDAARSAMAVEGLVRWRHPLRGMISPADFIPIAERSSLIDQLGEWVFRRACKDAPSMPDRRISINVSGEQLKRDEVVSMMRRVLHETGCSAERFVLEITETVATAASPEIIGRIEALREMGFRIALDDFGTGHCGFNYIKALPIDCIKIDRSYIRNLGSDGIAQVFVSALAQIARIQGLTIVAEGIETEAEFEFARAAGCTRFQGFLFGRPERFILSGDEKEALLVA